MFSVLVFVSKLINFCYFYFQRSWLRLSSSTRCRWSPCWSPSSSSPCSSSASTTTTRSAFSSGQESISSSQVRNLTQGLKLGGMSHQHYVDAHRSKMQGDGSWRFCQKLWERVHGVVKLYFWVVLQLCELIFLNIFDGKMLILRRFKGFQSKCFKVGVAILMILL